MLHAVKRQVARAHQPITSAPNAQFADLKHRLHSIKLALQYTSKMLTSANRAWIIQIQQQRNFSNRFFESYPTTDDEIYQVAAQFAQGSQALYDKFTREVATDVTAYDDIHNQVHVYIREINKVEAMYSRLNDAKSESSRYQSKIDSMERSRRPTDDHKKLRNLQKMDHHKLTYKNLLAETIKAQKAAYEKHPIVFKAALTAYWLSHEKHVTLLVKSLENTQQFVKTCEPEMRALDIATWVPAHQKPVSLALSINDKTHSEDGKENGLLEGKAATSSHEKATTLTTVTVESPTSVADTFGAKVPVERKEVVPNATETAQLITHVA